MSCAGTISRDDSLALKPERIPARVANIIAGVQIDAIQLVTGNKPRDLVENRQRIERAEPGFKILAVSQTAMRSASPDCAPRDWPRSADIPRLAEWHQRLDFDAHGVREANENFKIGFHAGRPPLS